MFLSQDGRTWTVEKKGLSFMVNGPREEHEKLHEIARSCAQQLGMSCLKNGTPLEYINQHQRIWTLIWHNGDIPEEDQPK
jgi:cell division protein ZapA (FtsZ GTPase activity inhibitor)